MAISTNDDPWTAYYYNNPDWSGSPVQVDTAPYLQFDWRYGSPGPNVPVDYFSARFDANGYFKAQPYLFKIVADDEFVLMINGAVRLDTRGKNQHAKTFEKVITFESAKTRPVTVFFRELTEVAYIRFSWQPYKGETGGGSGGGNHEPVLSGFREERDHAVRQLRRVHPEQLAPVVVLHVHRRVGCAEHGIDHRRTEDRDLGQLRARSELSYFQVSCDPNVAKKSYRCSKTGAGWYPY